MADFVSGNSFFLGLCTLRVIAIVATWAPSIRGLCLIGPIMHLTPFVAPVPAICLAPDCTEEAPLTKKADSVKGGGGADNKCLGIAYMGRHLQSFGKEFAGGKRLPIAR